MSGAAASLDALERIEAADRAALRHWFAAHHACRASVWLIRLRGAAFPYVAVVEECLCWGWIDSRPRKLDATRSLLLLSPRRPGSGWSEINRAAVGRLQAAGLLAPPGLAAIERAKADGSWDRLAAVDGLAVPPDLAAAFAAAPTAATNFAAFPPSARRGILEWIVQARRPETRARRVAETVAEALLERRANAWRAKPA